MPLVGGGGGDAGCALTAIVMLTCIILLGAENTANILWSTMNIVLLVWTAGYVGQMQAQRYLAVSVNRLKPLWNNGWRASARSWSYRGSASRPLRGKALRPH